MWLLLALNVCTDASTPGTGADSGLEDPDTACQEAYSVTWANWGDGFFLTYCRSCHSGSTTDRQGAPEGVDFDTLRQVRDRAAEIEDVVLVKGRMPVGGGVFSDDLILLEDFLACGLETR